MKHYYIETNEHIPRTIIVDTVIPEDFYVEVVSSESKAGQIYRLCYMFVGSEWLKIFEPDYLCLVDDDIYIKRELMYSACDWLPSGYIPV